MRSEALRERTKHLALRVIRLVDELPGTPAGRAVAQQVVRSATSVGANCRAAQRGRSTAEFLAKLGIAVEESDETCYWLEIIAESGLIPAARLEDLMDEANQITAILTASRKTAQANARSDRRS